MFEFYDKELSYINNNIKNTDSNNYPKLFDNLPIDIYANLLWFNNHKYENIKDILPTMADVSAQMHWTGSAGTPLLMQSTAFVKSIEYFLARKMNKSIAGSKILDFGCGWGRLLRIFTKYVAKDNLYGVDPSEHSLNLCREHNVFGNLALSDYILKKLPFEDKFDLIFAFSVFTHLSEEATIEALKTFENHMTKDGVLAITVRPKSYWNDIHFVHHENHLSETERLNKKQELIDLHDKSGFSFFAKTDTYGDTSITREYIENNLTNWQIIGSDFNSIDPYQELVFLKLK